MNRPDDVVMLPSAGDMEPMLRRDVLAEYGPLKEFSDG